MHVKFIMFMTLTSEVYRNNSDWLQHNHVTHLLTKQDHVHKQL